MNLTNENVKMYLQNIFLIKCARRLLYLIFIQYLIHVQCEFIQIKILK